MWNYNHKDNHAENSVNNAQGKSNDTTITSSSAVARTHPTKHLEITILQLIQFIIQISSVAAFAGSILYDEILGQFQHSTFLEQEPFAAVGQWNYIAVIVLVLFAAVVSRIWVTNQKGGGADDIFGGEIRSLEKGREKLDEEWVNTEEWDSRVGYAS